MNFCFVLFWITGAILSARQSPRHAELAVRSSGVSQRTLGANGTRPGPFPEADPGGRADHWPLLHRTPQGEDLGVTGPCHEINRGPEALNVLFPFWMRTCDWLQCNSDFDLRPIRNLM